MSKEITFLLGALIFFVIMMIGLIIYNKFRLRQKIAREWGKIPRVTMFDQEESLLEAWESFQQIEPAPSQVDDITWHDLDLMRLFELVNGTKSSVGAEALYARMRTLAAAEKDTADFQELVNYFETHDTERAQLQYQLAGLGKQDKNLLWFYLANPKRSALGHAHLYSLLAGLPFVWLLCLLLTQNGIFVGLLIFNLMANVIVYQIKKQTLERELVCMSYLVNSLGLAEKISSVAQPTQPEMKQLSHKLRSLTWFGFAFQSKSGSEAELMAELFMMLFLLPLLSYNSVLKKLSQFQTEAVELLKLIGNLDAALAVLNFKKIMPYTATPIFGEELTAKGTAMYHPLLSQPVPNDVAWQQNVLVTGSNASGKSTYIKGVALNCILAQTIGLTCSQSWQMKRGAVFSSMALEDDLFKGDSYFIAELKSLQRIIKQVQTGQTTYCFIDEILRGTNTIERIAASAAIVRWLSAYPSLVFVATHDIELTEILQETCENIHFSERVTAENGIEFDYLLKTGPARTRNALKLLAVMDYPQPVVAQAEQLAQGFEESRQW